MTAALRVQCLVSAVVPRLFRLLNLTHRESSRSVSLSLSLLKMLFSSFDLGFLWSVLLFSDSLSRFFRTKDLLVSFCADPLLCVIFQNVCALSEDNNEKTLLLSQYWSSEAIPVSSSERNQSNESCLE